MTQNDPDDAPNRVKQHNKKPRPMKGLTCYKYKDAPQLISTIAFAMKFRECIHSPGASSL